MAEAQPTAQQAWGGASPRPPGATYLVGGAVRDEILGLPVRERDWVVVGSTPAEMAQAGFRPVGKDFPVFLHPHSGEEYALARTERKSGHGHAGFEFFAERHVTLEQDLARRDLSINAIAKTADGQLIDPYSGLQDLRQRQLRHVSEHFVEDPLRVLRVARFKARFHSLGFHINEGTLALLREISASGELQHLTPERCWKETEKALLSEAPAEFFRSLRACGALPILFPEVDALYGVPQTPKYHPEIDSGIHAMLALEQAARISPALELRFAVLCHDFGKGTTPQSVLPSHRGHEQRGVPLIEAFCARLKTPKQLKQVAQLVAEYHLHCHKAFELRPDTLHKLLDALDAFRRPERLEIFALACKADARGRTGLENDPYPQSDYLLAAAEAARRVDVQELLQAGHQGAGLGRALQKARIAALAAFKQDYQNNTNNKQPSSTR